MKILALVGKARSGKNTAAEFLLGEGYEFLESFAGPLKEAAQIIFNLTEDEVNGLGYDREQPTDWGFSVREILQKLGTESIRDVFGQEHWVDLMRCRLTELELTPCEGVIITDARFENEVQLVHEFGGTVLGLERPGFESNVRAHSSEAMASGNLADVCDFVISARSVEELHAELARAREGLLL